MPRCFFAVVCNAHLSALTSIHIIVRCHQAMKLLLILFSTANALIDTPSIVGSKAFERSSGVAFVANGSALVGSDKAALTSDNLTTSQKQKVSSLLNGLEVALGSYNLLGDSGRSLCLT